jgi:hypothetical protein
LTLGSPFGAPTCTDGSSHQAFATPRSVSSPRASYPPSAAGRSLGEGARAQASRATDCPPQAARFRCMIRAAAGKDRVDVSSSINEVGRARLGGLPRARWQARSGADLEREPALID